MSRSQLETPTDARRAIEQAEELVRAGRPLDAVDHLHRFNRGSRSDEVEIRLAQLRYLAFDAVVPSSVHPAWPVPVADPHPPGPPRVPRLRGEELSGPALRREIDAHGAVHVPGLVGPDLVRELVDGIRTSKQTRADNADRPLHRGDAWFSSLPLPPGLGPTLARQWVAGDGAVLAADAPRLLDLILGTYEDLGLKDVITDYLGERPILSANKCTLREQALSGKTDWHQDGAFMGADRGIRAINVWVALTDCGVDAPGMDLVPRRFETVQETGTGGAIFDWAVGPETVSRLAADHPVVRPHFKAGDAMLFDDLYLHRSAIDENMVRPRFAIESWFFARTDYPEGQIPLVW